MSTDLNPNAVEDLLRSSKLDPKITENLRNHFDQLTAATTPGWHGPNDIPSLHRLEGTFLWFEDSPSLPRNITFPFDPADLLRSSKLDPKITENLRNHFDQLTAATTPGWHGPNDVAIQQGVDAGGSQAPVLKSCSRTSRLLWPHLPAVDR